MSEAGKTPANELGAALPLRAQLQETLASAQVGATEILSILRRDQQERWRQGERVTVEEYLKVRPELGDNRDGLLDLVRREVYLREELGERPGVDEYVRRFPQFEEALRQQFAVRAALREPASPEDDPTGPTRIEAGAAPHLAPEAIAKPDVSHVHIDGYQILAEIGRGGMGVVYKARQLKLDRIVAIKMVLAGVHAGAEGLARFKIEAEAAAQLQHPNIVQIYEISEQDGHPYYSLEFVEGETLEGKYGGRPMEAHAAARLIEQLARAMQAAHERGVIHRDLKPANILIALDGTPKITDFGLAKRLDSDVMHTRTGDIMGTPSYMAPEQAAGRTREVGPCSDIYALGAILYDLVTGRPPFQGASLLDTLEQVRNQDPVPPRRFQVRVPADLETIVLKCLEKEPAKRYGTALHLAEDLQRFLAGEPISARPVSRVERAWRWCKRNPALATACGFGIAAAITALIFSINLAITKSQAAAASAAALEKSQRLGHRVIAEIVLSESRAAATAINETLRQAQNDVKQVPSFPPIPAIIRCWDNNGKDPEEPGSDLAANRRRLAQILIVQMENEPTRTFSSFLDDQGNVVERIENRNGKIIRADESELGNRKDEDYFRQGSTLSAGQIFVSNVEIRRVPPKGNTVYLCTAVIDARGKRRGVFVIGINADELVRGLHDIDRRFRSLFPYSPLTLQLGDDQGRILYDIRDPLHNFSAGHELFKSLKAEYGHFDRHDKIGAYHKIHFNPLDPAQFWAIVMEVPKDLELHSEQALESLTE